MTSSGLRVSSSFTAQVDTLWWYSRTRAEATHRPGPAVRVPGPRSAITVALLDPTLSAVSTWSVDLYPQDMTNKLMITL